MDHVVAAEVAWAAATAGHPTLRFNFRGVGASQGEQGDPAARLDLSFPPPGSPTACHTPQPATAPTTTAATATVSGRRRGERRGWGGSKSGPTYDTPATIWGAPWVTAVRRRTAMPRPSPPAVLPRGAAALEGV